MPHPPRRSGCPANAVEIARRGRTGRLRRKPEGCRGAESDGGSSARVAREHARSYTRFMGARAAFVVPVHDLDVGGKSVHFELTPAWLRGALEGCEIQPAGAGGALEAHLSKSGNDVLVQGQIDVDLVVACARCLAPALLRPHIELSLLLVPAEGGSARGRPTSVKSRTLQGRAPKAAGPEDASEFSAEEADTDTYDGDEVVLDRFVREAILLESPIFPLCSEACEGIRRAAESSPVSGQAVTDPRLLPLLELAKRRIPKE